MNIGQVRNNKDMFRQVYTTFNKFIPIGEAIGIMSKEDPKPEIENPEIFENKNEAEKESSRRPSGKSTQDEINYYSESALIYFEHSYSWQSQDSDLIHHASVIWGHLVASKLYSQKFPS